MSPLLQSLLLRLLKGFVSGALTTMTLISMADIHVWNDIGNALNILTIAGVAGGINGLLLAAQKAYSWKE